MKNQLSLLILLGAFAISGCNSALYDSSVDINGNKVDLSKNGPRAQQNTQKNQETTKNKPVVLDTATQKIQVEQAIESEANQNQDPKYVPNHNLDVQTVNIGANQYDPLNSTSASALPKAFDPDSTLAPVAPVIPLSQNAVPEAKQEALEQNSAPFVSNTQSSALGALSADKCSTPLKANIHEEAYKLTLGQAERLKDENGPIYVSKTIIADSLKNCISDVSLAINQAFTENNVSTVLGQNNTLVQNAGQSSIIPQLIRACKQSNIPLINVSFIRHIGNKVVLTIRNIRVKDGITLVQNTKQIQ